MPTIVEATVDRVRRRLGMMGDIKAQYDCIAAFSETDFTEDLKRIEIPVFRGDITNIPGKSLSVETVTYAPGAVSGSHRHAKSAYIYAYVLEGAIRSQVEGEPARIFHAGESWVEAPGAHHVVGENASKTAPAKLLAVFVVDTTDTALTTPDR